MENSAASSSSSNIKKPTVVIVVGMAGCGKTTVLQRCAAWSNQTNTRSYFVNLDPAVLNVPYSCNIDIRDTVKYKAVMKEYGLGPNGAIMTSLNLFSTQFHEVLSLIEKRAESLDFVFVDTPGQIEVFTWSASGQIVTETLASTFPTVVLYVTDLVRCQKPITFMSTMLYACSINYRFSLPFVVALNKQDAAPAEPVIGWMKDYEAFQAALETDESYMSSLARSMSLVLDEFYRVLPAVPMSALTGQGTHDLMVALIKGRTEYDKHYMAFIERRMAERRKLQEQVHEEEKSKFAEEIKKSGGGRIAFQPGPKPDVGEKDWADDYGIQPEEDECDDDQDQEFDEEEMEEYNKLMESVKQ